MANTGPALSSNLRTAERILLVEGGPSRSNDGALFVFCGECKALSNVRKCARLAPTVLCRARCTNPFICYTDKRPPPGLGALDGVTVACCNCSAAMEVTGHFHCATCFYYGCHLCLGDRIIQDSGVDVLWEVEDYSLTALFGDEGVEHMAWKEDEEVEDECCEDWFDCDDVTGKTRFHTLGL